MTIGILGLQGAVREHIHCLSRLGTQWRVVKRAGQLDGLAGMILPGGESTTISLLADGALFEELCRLANTGFPFFGTCAGMILLATKIEGQQNAYIGAIDITIARNASGRQVNSFETALQIKEIGDEVPVVFIRAPYVTRVGQGVLTLAEHDNRVVAARQANVLVTSFHPELTDDLRIHRYFTNMVQQWEKEVAS